jgi:hypothetical protein
MELFAGVWIGGWRLARRAAGGRPANGVGDEYPAQPVDVALGTPARRTSTR